MTKTTMTNSLTTSTVSITIALAGNPNSGKTTLFNNLTGSTQHVGNYPGVTVDIKEGVIVHGNYRIRVIDLPGTYSLSAYSEEEIVARDFILNEHPDLVVDVVDGSSLERHLYLPVQLFELGVPLVIALNMADEMKRKGIKADTRLLEDFFQAPVVATIGSRNRGTGRLIEKIIETYEQKKTMTTATLRYDREIEEEIDKLTGLLAPRLGNGKKDDYVYVGRDDVSCGLASPRWLAMKLLENDKHVRGVIDKLPEGIKVTEQVQKSRQHLRGVFADEPEMIIAEQRYGHVHGICRAGLKRTVQARVDFSDKIDQVLTNRVLGLPIFGLLMYLTFYLVFTLGSYPMGWIESGQEGLMTFVDGRWSPDSLPLLRSLVMDGIIAGVGGVVVFLPNIMLLFFALALLEDTGYMARAAFIMDRLMKWIGLHGKSFIPMLCGFGCTVPGILGTRILENRRDRLTTILVLPLMSCGARIPIYLLIIPAFFLPSHSALIMFIIYIIGILLAIVCARVLRSTVFKGEASPFVMELPPYRIPTYKALWLHTWHRSWMYLKKAGTVILGITVILWALSMFPRMPKEMAEPGDMSEQASLSDEELALAQLEYSYLGRFGQAVEPVFRPLGFDWRIDTALLGALAAKEVFVAQLGVVFALGETDLDEESSQNALRNKLRHAYNPLIGFCVMLFCLISSPCIATFAATKREVGYIWACLQTLGLTVLAYVITLVVYQVGSWLSIGVV